MGMISDMRFGRPVDGETIAVTVAADVSTLFRPRSSMVRLSVDTTGDMRYRVSRDIFKSGDFESKRIWKLVDGVADVEGAVLSRYARWAEIPIYGGVAGKVVLNKTTPLFGTRDVVLTGHVTELIVNGDFETPEVGGDAPGWAEALLGGGAIDESLATFNTGLASQEFTAGAGGVGTNLSQQFAVTAGSLYGIIGSLYGDGVAGISLTVVDDFSGEYLTAAGVWQVAAATILTQAAAAWADVNLPFVAQATATTVTVTATILANNGTGFVDSVGCSLIENELIQQSFIPVVDGKTMQLVINHMESAVPAGLQCALQPVADPTIYMQANGTTWNATEYWAPIVGGVVSTEFTRAFTPDFSGLLLLRIRAASLGGLTAQIDDVYTWELAVVTDALHPGGHADIFMDQAGRVSAVMGAGAANMVVSTLIP